VTKIHRRNLAIATALSMSAFAKAAPEVTAADARAVGSLDRVNDAGLPPPKPTPLRVLDTASQLVDWASVPQRTRDELAQLGEGIFAVPIDMSLTPFPWAGLRRVSKFKGGEVSWTIKPGTLPAYGTLCAGLLVLERTGNQVVCQLIREGGAIPPGCTKIKFNVKQAAK
jgi:hypothetical protein